MSFFFKLSVTVCLLVAFNATSWAATKVWLIGKQKAIKLNVATNSVEVESSLSASEKKNFYDARSGTLFVLNSTRPHISEVYLYDIKTLTKKGKLDLAINLNLSDEFSLLFPVAGNVFYARWIKDEGGTPEIVVYDLMTLKATTRYFTNPSTSNMLVLSEAGDILYSMRDDENVLKIDAFETSKFTFKNSIDLKGFFGTNVTGFSIQDYKKQRILISESSTSESLKYVYDIPQNIITKKINIKGQAYLIVQTNRIANLEKQYAGKFKSMSVSTDYLFSGKVNIYDSITGQKVTSVTVPVVSPAVGTILGTSPSEDKLYVLTYNASGVPNPKLYIINLANYSVIKELIIPEPSVTMVFYEE